MNPTALELGDLDNMPCLVLLGEPGMGKSVAVESAVEDIEKAFEGQDDDVLYFDLGSTRREEKIENEIFGSDKWARWSSGTHRLQLYLDALDEALLRVETVQDILAQGLGDADTARLSLRIACRSADRHYDLERQLRGYWGDDQSKVIELAPLRRADVRTAAEAKGLDPDQFVQTVIERGLQPLAIKPVTLRQLVAIASAEGDLPISRLDAYERGCLLLCDEPDENRRTGSTAGELTPGMRFSVATRIAAATILAGRSSVALDDGATAIAEDEATVSQLSGQTETDRTVAAPTTFPVGVDAVRESLGTGLFASRGDNRMGWAHQTYGEFMAAKRLANPDISLDQITDFLVTGSEDRWSIVPQLREVARWLASMRLDIFELVMAEDPTVLLAIDPSGADDETKRRLVEVLFSSIADQKIELWDRAIRQAFSGYAHSGLADQLRDAIASQDLHLHSRYVAIDVAVACAVSELAGIMADIALDETEPVWLRAHAANALSELGSDDDRSRVIPLAVDSLDEDKADEIKGCALDVVYPGLISTQQMLASLTVPKRPSTLGIYGMFLRQKVISNLGDDLGMAMTWASSAEAGRRSSDPWETLIEEIFIEALQHLDLPDVAQASIEFVKRRLAQDTELIDGFNSRDGSPLDDAGARQRLVCGIVAEIAAGDIGPERVVYSTPLLLRGDDMPWVIAELQASIGSDLERGWALLAEALMVTSANAGAVMEARYESEALREITADQFDPVEIRSEKARRARETYEKWKTLREQDLEEEEALPDFRQLQREHLSDCESGNLDAWWQLGRAMGFEEGSRSGRSDIDSDLERFPGWLAADDNERERIVNCAKHYLEDGSPDPDHWIGTNTIYFPAVAGYRALRLVSETDPTWLHGHEPGIYGRWAPIVVAWPHSGTESESEFHEHAMREVMRHARDDAVRWFTEEIGRRFRADSPLLLADRFKVVDVAGLENGVMPLLEGEEGTPNARAELIGLMVGQHSPAGKQFAKTAVESHRKQPSDETRGDARAAALALIHDDPDAGWDVVWPAIEANEGFGADILQEIADRMESPMADKISESQAVDLFTWLERKYPTGDDPAIHEAHFVSPRERLGRFRDSLLSSLAAKGTPESIEALRTIRQRFSELDYLDRFIAQAIETCDRENWTPPAPELVVQICGDASRRYVKSASDLLRVVVGSLGRLQSQLQAGSPPIATSFWNTERNRFKPKQETELSDRIKQWLDHDLVERGVIAGREVEVRRAPGANLGESTDIRLDAVAGEHVEGAPIVSVVIEVKGCWNGDLRSAMETQLADRYMNPDEVDHGIYLTVWFARESWSNGDYRRARCRVDRDALGNDLEQQSIDLSTARSMTIQSLVLDASLPPAEGPVT